MQETFEHNISRQLDDFKLQPSPTVWQEVNAALRPKQKKRMIIWWWLGAAILAISALGFWATYYSSPNIFKKDFNCYITNNPASPSTRTIGEIKNRDEYQLNIDNHLVKHFNKRQKVIQVTPSISFTLNNQNTNLVIEEATTFNPNLNISYPYKTLDNVIVTTKILQLQKLDLNNKIDSADNIAALANTYNTDSNEIIKNQKKASAPSRWYITVGGGILQTSQAYKTNGLTFNNSAAVGSGATSPPVTGSGTNNAPAISNAKTGFNLQFGIAYNTELGKNWVLQTGLQYQYLANQQGLKADTTTGFANSFIADNNSFTTNKVHWLQVPITFTYNLQPKSKHKLCLLLGGSLAYTLSEKWLISNTSTGRLYYDATLNNRWLIGMHSGLSYALNERLNIAALAEYTLTPIQSNVTDKHHFVQYNMQISTPLNFLKKSSSKKIIPCNRTPLLSYSY